MRAVAGIFRRDGAAVEESVLRRMAATMHRRSPTDPQIVTAGCIGLVFLDEGHAQSPGAGIAQLAGDRAPWRIVCCGNLFNLAELCNEPGLSQGNSLGMAAAILQLYRRDGLGGLSKCNGSFAGAIWDGDNERLTLFRDPIGVVPLVYTIDAAQVAFASEAKAVLALPNVGTEPDEQAIAYYLTGSRYHLQPGKTFYRGIEKLMPGRAHTVDGTGDGKNNAFWAIDPCRKERFPSDQAAVDAVRDLVMDSVAKRMAPGPVGAALSGGFDSSTIVCAMHALGARDIETFSFDFGTDDADESELVDIVSDRAGTRHHHLNVLTPDYFDPLDGLIGINDGPLIEGSVILLNKKKVNAQQHGVVALLSGLGGDEVFMGRNNFLADLLVSGRWLAFLRELRGLYPYDYSTGKPSSLKTLLMAYIWSPIEPWWLKSFRKLNIQKNFPPDWIDPSLARRTGIDARLPSPEKPGFRSAFAQDCFEVFHYELTCAIEMHDTANVFAGTSSRFPFLDTRLVDLLFALPREWKISNGKVRLMQKQAMAEVLPPEVLADHLKKDFHPTLNAFMRTAFAPLAEAVLTKPDAYCRAYFDWKTLEKCHRDFLDGRASPAPIWRAVNIERWLTSLHR